MKYLNLIIAILITTTLSAKADSYAVPFYGMTDYTDSKKDSSTGYGLYYQSKNIKALIHYKDFETIKDTNTTSNSLKSFSQTNIAFGYNYEISKTIDLYTAINYINSSNNSYDGAYAILLGVKKQFNSFLLGLNYSHSYYNQNIVDNVEQISPYIAFSFGDYKSLMGSYYMKIMYDYIYLDEATLAPDYSVVGLNLIQNKGSFQNSFSYYGGDHIFALKNSGMSMQNLQHIYDRSLSLSSKYSFSDTTAIQVSFIRKDFVEYQETSKSKSQNITLFLHYKF